MFIKIYFKTSFSKVFESTKELNFIKRNVKYLKIYEKESWKNGVCVSNNKQIDR